MLTDKFRPSHGTFQGRLLRPVAVYVVLTLAAALAPRAVAQTLTVVYNFDVSGSGGDFPYGGVVVDSAGNLYGTTNQGGSAGFGVVFKIDTGGEEETLHNFMGPPSDGSSPYAGVVRDSAGNLYGTTNGGGMDHYGVVFKLSATGQETVLHSFTGRADGGVPYVGLTRDKSGNLYGVTYSGGRSGTDCLNGACGILFELSPTGKETVLHTFAGGPADGANPQGLLVEDSVGNLYGTTLLGGTDDNGTVFKLDRTTRKETVLYNFTGGADGGVPSGHLIKDPAGNLYGTTQTGGAFGFYGVVFKLDLSGHETVLYSFAGQPDGAAPNAGVVRDAAGNLYGTTEFGGTSGSGTVFEIDTLGDEIVLHNFTGGLDGGYPLAGVVLGSSGILYGTTDLGGTLFGGVAFKLVSPRNETQGEPESR